MPRPSHLSPFRAANLHRFSFLSQGPNPRQTPRLAPSLRPHAKAPPPVPQAAGPASRTCALFPRRHLPPTTSCHSRPWDPSRPWSRPPRAQVPPRPLRPGISPRPPAPAAAGAQGPAPPAAPLTASLTTVVRAGHLDEGRSDCRRFFMALREAQRQRRLRSETGAGPSWVEVEPGASLKRGADAGAQPVPSRSRNRPLLGLNGGRLNQSARGTLPGLSNQLVVGAETRK